MSKHYRNIVWLIAGIIFLLFLPNPTLKWIAISGLVLLFSIYLVVGISCIQFNYFFTATHTIPSDKILLTFDDGPHPEHTEKILAILNKHQIAAVFFVIGHKVDQHKTVLEKAIKDGHLIGNHTFSHPNTFALLPTKMVIKEIQEGQHALKEINGNTNRLFRTPIGVTNPNIARAIRKTNVIPIGWSVRTLDTQRQQTENWLPKIVSKTKKGSIVLFHDTQQQTLKHLEAYILAVKENGLEFVTTPELKTFFHG